MEEALEECPDLLAIVDGTEQRIQHKARRNPPLLPDHQLANRELASIRIVVEHTLSRMKHFKILVYPFRHSLAMYDWMVTLRVRAAGLSHGGSFCFPGSIFPTSKCGYRSVQLGFPFPEAVVLANDALQLNASDFYGLRFLPGYLLIGCSLRYVSERHSHSAGPYRKRFIHHRLRSTWSR